MFSGYAFKSLKAGILVIKKHKILTFEVMVTITFCGTVLKKLLN